MRFFDLREVDSLRAARPDLIILDYIISNEDDGWQTLQKLKMSRDLASTPVIICVAASQRIKEMEGHLTAKGVAIVLKPFDIYELIETVNYSLNRSKVQQTTPSVPASSHPIGQ